MSQSLVLLNDEKLSSKLIHVLMKATRERVMRVDVRGPGEIVDVTVANVTTPTTVDPNHVLLVFRCLDRKMHPNAAHKSNEQAFITDVEKLFPHLTKSRGYLHDNSEYWLLDVSFDNKDDFLVFLIGCNALSRVARLYSKVRLLK